MNEPTFKLVPRVAYHQMVQFIERGELTHLMNEPPIHRFNEKPSLVLV
jgi:hypothetical protein